jgi:hypothetical protein
MQYSNIQFITMTLDVFQFLMASKEHKEKHL